MSTVETPVSNYRCERIIPKGSVAIQKYGNYLSVERPKKRDPSSDKKNPPLIENPDNGLLMLDKIPINTTINQISRYEPNEEDCIKSKKDFGEIRSTVISGKEIKLLCDKEDKCTTPEASDGKIYYYDDVGYKDDVISTKGQPSFLSRLKSAFKYNGGKKSRKSKRRIRKTRILNKKRIKK